MLSSCVRWGFWIALVLGAPAAMAQDQPSTAAFGLAGAGSARVDDSTNIGRNPAAMLLAVRYAAQADFGFGAGPYARGALSDTRSSNLGAGASYVASWTSPVPTAEELPGWLPADGEIPENPTFSQSVRAGLGYGLFRIRYNQEAGSSEIRRLAFALSMSYDRVDAELGGVTQGFDGGVSVAGRPLPDLSLALSARDLLPGGPRGPSVELGAAWQRPVGALLADLAWDSELSDLPLSAHLGGELVLGEKLPLRAGYAFEGGSHALGFGLGVAAPKSRIDYGIQLHVGGPSSGLGTPGFVTQSVGLMALF